MYEVLLKMVGEVEDSTLQGDIPSSAVSSHAGDDMGCLLLKPPFISYRYDARRGASLFEV